MGIPDDHDYLCYAFDEAVLYFGRWVDVMLDVRHSAGSNKGKRKYTLGALLNAKPQKKAQSALSLMALGGVVIK